MSEAVFDGTLLNPYVTSVRGGEILNRAGTVLGVVALTATTAGAGLGYMYLQTPSGPHVPTPVVTVTVTAGQEHKQQQPKSGAVCETWLGDSAHTLAAVEATKQAAQASIIDSKLAPGGTVALVCGNRLVSSFAVGSDGRGRTISPATTKYDAASTTKMITGIGLEMLQDAGKLNLNDKLSKYYPNEYGKGLKAEVTLLELLQHRSGLNDGDNSPYSPLIAGNASVAQIQERMLQKPLSYAPGTKYRYSNIGFNLAYMVGSKAAGMPLNRYISEHLFQPLGMTETGYGTQKGQCAPTSPDANQSQTLQCTLQDRLGAALGGDAGHDGMFTTANDAAKVVGMLAADGVYDGKRYLSTRAIQEIKSVHYKANTTVPDSTYGIAARLNIAHGISGVMSSEAYGHSGWSGCVLAVDPTTGLGVVTLTNATYGRAVNDNTAYVIAKPINDAYAASMRG